MNGSRSRSRSDEGQIKNDYNSFEKTNETPNYIKELMISHEERNNNESKSNEDEIEEKSHPIKKDASSPNLSSIFLKKSQKENEDKSQEEEKGRRSCESIFSSFNEFLNQQKNFIEDEDDESKDINHIDMKELGKLIKMLIKFYMIWKKENKDKKLNKKENIIQRKEDQINECNLSIGKNFELENRISEQNCILDNLKESEEQKNKNDDLEKKNINLGKKVYGQNNKNSQLDIKIEQLVIRNKDLEDRKQKGENSKEKFNLILSSSEKELRNALKKKEEKEAKNRWKNKNISTKLKENKRKISIEKNKISESVSVIIERENLQKSKIINKGNKKNIKYFLSKAITFIFFYITIFWQKEIN